jgi:hypothetical protein
MTNKLTVSNLTSKDYFSYDEFMLQNLSTSKNRTLFEELGLATFRDGFIVGLFSALILQLGIIDITTVTQRAIVFVLLGAGILVSVNQAVRRKSLISPPWDGFISGFGTFIGIIELLLQFVQFLR